MMGSPCLSSMMIEIKAKSKIPALPLSSRPASMASMLYPVCLFFLLNFPISVSFRLYLQSDSEPKTLIMLLLNL